MARPESQLEAISESAPKFAEIAIPAHVTGTFTYAIPDEFADAITIGARVVVPFGRVQTTAYVTGLSAAEPTTEHELKEILELLDRDPVVVPEVLELTRWVSDYYAAPWGEVLKAALPSGMNATIRRHIAITPKGVELLNSLAAARLTKIHGHILQRASTAFRVTPSGVSSVDQRELEKELGETSAKRAISQLATDGMLTTHFVSDEPAAKPKQQRMIRLAHRPPAERDQEKQKPRPAQTRVLIELEANGGELPLADLLTVAKTGTSTIKALEERGLVEAFWGEVRRDPLVGRPTAETEEFTLSPEQADALSAIEQPLQAAHVHRIAGAGMRARQVLDQHVLSLVGNHLVVVRIRLAGTDEDGRAVPASKLLPCAPAQLCATNRFADQPGKTIPQPRGQRLRTTIEFGEAFQERFTARMPADPQHERGIAHVGIDAPAPAEHHQCQQHRCSRVDVPAEVKATVQEDEHQGRETEVHMGRQPARRAAGPGPERSAPESVPREIDDEHRRDRTQRVSQPGSPIGPAQWFVGEIRDECPAHEAQRDEGVPAVCVGEEGLMHAAPPSSPAPRGGAAASQLHHVIVADAKRRARGTGLDAGRAAAQVLAHVALDRGLRHFVGLPAQQPAQQGLLRGDLRHLDHAIRAVLLAVAAADAAVVDEDLAIGQSMYRIRRAIAHAMRMLTMAAGGREVKGTE